MSNVILNAVQQQADMEIDAVQSLEDFGNWMTKYAATPELDQEFLGMLADAHQHCGGQAVEFRFGFAELRSSEGPNQHCRLFEFRLASGARAVFGCVVKPDGKFYEFLDPKQLQLPEGFELTAKPLMN